MEDQFKTVTRGSRHGVPDKEADVAKLTSQYIGSKLHAHVDGRNVKPKDKAIDVVTIGATGLTRLVKQWFENCSLERGTHEWFGEEDEEAVIE